MQHNAIYLLFYNFTLHPSSGVHKTVTSASGSGHNFLCSYLPPAWSKYCSYFLFSQVQRGQASLATLEGFSYTKNMTTTVDCSYSFVYFY